MSGQLSFFDIVDEKDKLTFTPEVWKCQDTCSNFTNIDRYGLPDYFPGPGNVPRCVACMKGGKNGPNWKSKLINNVWHTWCLNYRPKEK